MTLLYYYNFITVAKQVHSITNKFVLLQSGSVIYKRAKLTGAQYKHRVIFTFDGNHRVIFTLDDRITICYSNKMCKASLNIPQCKICKYDSIAASALRISTSIGLQPKSTQKRMSPPTITQQAWANPGKSLQPTYKCG